MAAAWLPLLLLLLLGCTLGQQPELPDLVRQSALAAIGGPNRIAQLVQVQESVSDCDDACLCC